MPLRVLIECLFSLLYLLSGLLLLLCNSNLLFLVGWSVPSVQNEVEEEARERNN